MKALDQQSLSRMTAAGLIVFTLLVGCRGNEPAVGKVTGIVTMDGAPLPAAEISFTPSEGGRPASGTTDENGRYELVFNARKGGALVGEHIVSIGTAREANPERGQAAVKESVPPKYNLKSELTATVKAGHNNIDFPLTSK